MFKFGKKEKKMVRDDLMDISEPFDKPETLKSPDPLELKNDEERLKYDHVLKHFQDDNLLVATTEDDIGDKKPLTENERFWLTRECIMRYLRATKWVVADTIKRLEYTIAWRREFGISGDGDKFDSETVSIENQTGKQVILGYDKYGAKPLLYFKPGRQNTKTSLRQIQSTVWFLERVIDMMPSGQETLALLIDYKHHEVEGETSKIPSISTGRQVLHILQSHYPERLGKAMFTNLPLVASTFLKVIGPFIDPQTKEKLVYDKSFLTVVDDDQLDKDYGGRLNFEYKHDIYYPALVKLCNAKRKHRFERFQSFGAVIGLSEYDLKGYDEKVRYPVNSNL